MIQHLLVPVDRSKFGEHAVPWALSLAKRCDAQVHLVHVQTPVTNEFARLSGSLIEPYDVVVRKENEGYLSRLATLIKEETGADAQTSLLEGEISECLRRKAVSLENSLFIMTTHGRGPLRRFWLGSVADRMVRQSSVPVMLVRPSLAPLDIRRDCVVQHALVPLDGSSLAEGILPHIVPLCQAWGAELTLLQMIEPDRTLLEHQMVANLAPSALPLKSELERIDRLHKQEAQTYLAGACERLQGQGLTVHTSVMSDVSPGPAILKTAEESNQDLIALATHGRGGLSRFFLGSVADKVIRGTDNPVLVYRPESE